MSTHNVLSYAKRIDEICLGEWWQSNLLITNRDDLKLEIELKPTKVVTWFAYSSLYKHFSVLMQYEGKMIHKGETVELKGLCTLESWKAVATSMLKNKLLVNGNPP